MSKLQQLTKITTGSGNFLIPVSDDPTGTGSLKAITITNLSSLLSVSGSSMWGGISGTLSNQTDLQNALNLKSPIASPTFTGVPSGTTAPYGTNSQWLATTSFVNTLAMSVSGGTSLTAGSGIAIVANAIKVDTTTTVDVNTPQTLLNKTLTSPLINGAFLSTTTSGVTQSANDNSTKLATTAYVSSAVLAASGGVTSVAGRTGAITLAEADITNLVSDLGAKAALASPTFTGVPAGPTAIIGTNTTQLATTAFVMSASGGVTSVAGRTGAITLAEADITNLVTDLSAKAPLASPVFTGVPAGPTAAYGVNTTQLATTAFVSTLANSVSGTPLTAGSGIAISSNAIKLDTTYAVDVNSTQTLSNKTVASGTFSGQSQFKYLGYSSVYDNGIFITSGTINLGANGNVQKFSLSGNCTLTITAPLYPGPFVLYSSQDAVGTRLLTWPAGTKSSGGVKPVLTTSPNALDVITGQYDGVSYHVALSIPDSK